MEALPAAAAKLSGRGGGAEGRRRTRGGQKGREKTEKIGSERTSAKNLVKSPWEHFLSVKYKRLSVKVIP